MKQKQKSRTCPANYMNVHKVHAFSTEYECNLPAPGTRTVSKKIISNTSLKYVLKLLGYGYVRYVCTGTVGNSSTGTGNGHKQAGGFQFPRQL